MKINNYTSRFRLLIGVIATMSGGFASAQCPTITCPGNSAVNNTPGMCGATVAFNTPVGTNPCAAPVTQTYNFTGGVQTFLVPAGITSIVVDAYGAQGGNAAGPGGLGGLATATVPVTPGETINIYVGGRGQDGNVGGNGVGGYNGGGNAWQLAPGDGGSGGGGGSDIRRTPYGLTERLVVGGGGGGSENNGGGPMYGGAGGGLVGGDGQVWGGNTATGGTQNAGGVANTGTGCDAQVVLATNGSFGLGGAGGRCLTSRCGGGGGGGWYGGGGVTRGNGAGGGSGYVAAPGNLNTSMSSGVRSGDGQVMISYTPIPVTVQTSGLPSGSTFPIGVTTNTFTVNDGIGNTANCSFTVTVTDNQNPVITAPANIIVNNDAGACGAIVNYTVPSGTDNCTPTTVLTGGLGSGSAFPLGNTTETYTVTDPSGNSASASFTITVVDNEAPVLNCQNITVNNDPGACGAVVNYVAPAGTDNCAGVTVAFVSGLGSGSTFPVGITTEMFSATDAAGLTSTCSFTVTVVDTEVPSVVSPANVTSCNPVVTNIAPVATDNCSVASVTYALTGATTGNGNTDASGSTFNTGITSVTYTATDVNGNVNSSSFNVVVNVSYNNNATASICQGKSILLGGAQQTQAGTYVDQYTTALGCDSIITTVLTVNPLPTVSLAAFVTDSVCITVAPIALPAGTPSGGTYSGLGVVGANFNPNTAGVGAHYVMYSYSDANGCQNSDSTKITVLLCTGIDENTKFQPVVYPNPASEQVTINLGATYKAVEVSVLELNGRVVMTNRYNYTSKVTSDISGLSTGMYFLQIKADGQATMVKVVKN